MAKKPSSGRVKKLTVEGKEFICFTSQQGFIAKTPSRQIKMIVLHKYKKVT